MQPLQPLDLRDALAVITSIVTVVGVYFTLRFNVAKLTDGQIRLQSGQDEGNRKIDALHKRLDYYGAEITRIDKDNVRLEERIKALKESQNFRLRSRLAAAEAAVANEPPMFMDEGGE
jgi:peptidoglycan hydrolase CwlO-like protein